jgi:hypothetical protein
MVDLMLEDPSVPAPRADRDRFCALIQAVDVNLQSTTHNSLKAFYAETAFKKLC